MTDARPRWSIVVSRQAEKALQKTSADLRRRLEQAIDALADDPRPHGCKRLTGYDLYRIRVGSWRISYKVQDDRLIVVVVEVAPRGSAYRDL
jgi:mRNA interferase RelE/StbE